MRIPLMALVVCSVLSGTSGCNTSTPTTSGTVDKNTNGTVAKSTDGQGWKTESEDVRELGNGDTTYGSYDANSGHRVRATASAQPEPVDLKLYVVDGTGKETTLAEKKKTLEAVLEGKVPYNGTLMLRIRFDSGKKTSCKYKIERR